MLAILFPSPYPPTLSGDAIRKRFASDAAVFLAETLRHSRRRRRRHPDRLAWCVSGLVGRRPQERAAVLILLLALPSALFDLRLSPRSVSGRRLGLLSGVAYRGARTGGIRSAAYRVHCDRAQARHATLNGMTGDSSGSGSRDTGCGLVRPFEVLDIASVTSFRSSSGSSGRPCMSAVITFAVLLHPVHGAVLNLRALYCDGELIIRSFRSSDAWLIKY